LSASPNRALSIGDVSNSQVAVVTGGARGIKADYVVPATKQATLDRLPKFAAHSGLGAEITFGRSSPARCPANMS
jgi:hypothetical protein